MRIGGKRVFGFRRANEADRNAENGRRLRRSFASSSSR